MMDHKAFVFHYDAFFSELAPVLFDALGTDSSNGLLLFIESHFTTLKDPYEGDPLNHLWADGIESFDPHQLGDYALTKYYDPRLNLGLGSAWQEIQEALPEDFVESPILGIPFGPESNLFDPGKMGSYFQSNDRVAQNEAHLEAFVTMKHGLFDPALRLLQTIAAARLGLYVTF